MNAPTTRPKRHHALAALDRLIEEAELAQAQQRAEVERIIAERRQPRLSLKSRNFAAEHLAALYRSREALLAEETGK